MMVAAVGLIFGLCLGVSLGVGLYTDHLDGRYLFRVNRLTGIVTVYELVDLPGGTMLLRRVQ
jgi:hypothetical protein